MNGRHLLSLLMLFALPPAVVAEDDLPTLETLEQRASLERPEITLPSDLVTVPVISPSEFHVPPSVRDIPEDQYGALVKLGRNIFIDTRRYAGAYVGNGLNCSSCHLQEGRKPHAAPMWAAWPVYPMYRDKSRQVVSLQERMQDCFRFSLNGIAPPLDTIEIKALTTYVHWLSTDIPVGALMAGRGFARIDKSRDPSSHNGEALFSARCALCHGEDGLGRKRADGSYQFPPLWGPDSYNRGAGLAKNKTCAAFIKANMPPGQGYTLNDDEALDVCAFIWLHDRPWSPAKSWFANLFHKDDDR